MKRLLVCVGVSFVLPAGAAQAATWCVPSASLGCDAGHTQPTIAAVIAGGSVDGDTILIGPGTHPTPTAAITKRLTFIGRGSGTTTTVNPATDTILEGQSGASALSLTRGGELRSLRAITEPPPAATSGLDTLVLSGTGGGTVEYRLRDVVAIGGPHGVGGTFGGQAVEIPSSTGTTVRTDVSGGAFVGGVPDSPGAYLHPEAGSTTFTGSQFIATGNEAAALARFAPATFDRVSIPSGDYGFSFDNAGPFTVRRSRLTPRLEALFVSNYNGVTTVNVEDTLIAPTGDNAFANGKFAAARVFAGGPTATATLAIRGSTLLMSDDDGWAAVRVDRLGGTQGTASASLRNALARLTGAIDPAARALLAEDGASITAASSAFNSSAASGGGSAPAPGSGTNVGGDPGLAPDFSLLPTSPMIDRGDPAFVTPGELDLAGAARSQDGNDDCVARPDIGAFERAVTAASVLRCTPPVLSGVSLLRKKFTVRKPRHKRRKRGTRFRFTLSKDAKVKISFALRAKGRKVGKKCKAPTRRNRKRKRCVRYVSKGSRTVNGKAGRNNVAFSGKVGKRRLKPGRYRATLVATDPRGSKSVSRRLTFTVLRP